MPRTHTAMIGIRVSTMKKLELDERLEKAAYELRMSRGELLDRWLKMEEENGYYKTAEQKQSASTKIEELETRLVEVEKKLSQLTDEICPM